MTLKLKHLLTLSIILFLSLFLFVTNKDVACAAEEGALRIGERVIQYADCEEITTGDGWKFVNSTKTLYLDNANLEGQDIEAYNRLNVSVTGVCTISQIDVCGMKNIALNIYGPGTLNIKYSGKPEAGYPSWYRLRVEGGDLSIKNCDINTDIFFKKNMGCIISCEQLNLDNCNLISNVETTSTKKFANRIIHCESLNMKNSSIKTTGVLGGILISNSKKSTIKNSSIDINCDNTHSNSGIETVDVDNLYITDSKIDITSTSFAIVFGGENTNIKNSTINLKTIKSTNKSVGQYPALYLVDGKTTCSNNTKINVTGAHRAIYISQAEFVLNSGKITANGMTDAGVYMEARSYKNKSRITINNGTFKVSGKKYGIQAINAGITVNKGTLDVTSTSGPGIYFTTKEKSKSVFTINGGTVKATGKSYGLSLSADSKLSFKKGTLTLTGKKYAINKISKLPKIAKKHVVKVGSKKANAKKTNKLKKNYKYIYYKIK